MEVQQVSKIRVDTIRLAIEKQRRPTVFLYVYAIHSEGKRQNAYRNDNIRFKKRKLVVISFFYVYYILHTHTHISIYLYISYSRYKRIVTLS